MKKVILLSFLLGFAVSIRGFCQENILLVTYGTEARSIEGDADYQQIIYFMIPAASNDILYLRLFDADMGGTNDAPYGPLNTETRFSLYGGAGAFSTPGLRSIRPDQEDVEAGVLIQQATYGQDPTSDNRWVTFAQFMPDAGEPSGSYYVFKLAIEGIDGNDGNVYDIAVSIDDRQNVSPAGISTFTYSPTIRLDRRDLTAELRFEIPDETSRLTVQNFDAARATLTMETAFRSIPVSSSGQGQWQSSEISLLDIETNRSAALTFAGDGQDFPNDATFYAAGQDGVPLPIEMPIYAYTPHLRPTARVVVEPLADCYSAGFDASGSTDPTGSILDYAWDFGDGSVGDGRSPVHRYDSPGTYSGYLMITDASGRTTSGAAESFSVLIKLPPTATAGQDRVVAPDEEVSFTGTASTDVQHEIIRYIWDFNDGAMATGQTVSHVFQQPGDYIVTLRAEDNANHPCNFGTDQLSVRVNAAPVAEAGETLVTSIGESFVMNGMRSYDTDGSITQYEWDLGDGTRLQGETIEHAYRSAGRFQVTLTVQDDAGVANSSDSDEVTIAVNAPPVAVAGDDKRVAIGEVISFDASESTDPDGALIGYRWDFGDGGEGSDRQVPYAYRSSGNYTVTLTVRDNSGTRSNTGSDSLMVFVNAPPMADAGPDQRVTTTEVQFDASRSNDDDGQIDRYFWEFGDGTTSTDRSPVHAYRNTGTYHVRLTVTDDSGTIRNDHEDEVTIIVNAMPVADAGIDHIGVPDQAFQFDGSHSLDPDGGIEAYSWDFGDGSTATGALVSHAYASPGTYTVRLMVQDNTGDVLAIDYDDAVVVVNQSPVALAGPDLLVAPGETVTLDGNHSFDLDGTITGYRWVFSDTDETITEAEANRTYTTPGYYTARLTVTDDSGVSNATADDEVAIHVNHTPNAMAGTDQHLCEATVFFDASASTDADGDPLTYLWNFGDGSEPMSGVTVNHAYVEGGSYPVVLTVDDGTARANAHDVSDLIVSINRFPVAMAGNDTDVCAGDVVLFDGSGSYDPEGGLLRYTWDFGDGETAEGINPTKVYKEGGVFPVIFSVQDDSGLPCNTTVDQLVVRVAESPIAAAGSDIKACTNKAVQFDGSQSKDFDGVVNRFRWDFGDGSTGGGMTPVHTYTIPGTYRVTLTIEGDEREACDNIDTDEITVTVSEGPVAAFQAPPSVPRGAPVSFDGSPSSGAGARITSWQWDFGDGSEGAGESVTHTYSEAGQYTVRLTIETDSDEQDCNVTSSQQAIIVNAPPIADAGFDQHVSIHEEVVLIGDASGDEDGAITGYTWDFGDGSSAMGVDVRHRFRESGEFPVLLTVTDDAGLPNSSDTDTVTVVVNAPPVPVIEMPEQACIGQTVSFDGSRSTDEDDEVVAYDWRFGDGASAEGAEVTHRFETTGTFAVDLQVDDGMSLLNSRVESTRQLIINEPPQPVAGPDKLVCAQTPVPFDGQRSIDLDGTITRFRWDFDDGDSVNGASVSHAFDEPGFYNVNLTVTDDSDTPCGTIVDTARVIVNAAPVADAGPDREGFYGGVHDAFAFDGSASFDPDGTPLTYEWDFGDGNRATGRSVFYAYSAAGQYTVRLSVSDGTGLPCGMSYDEVRVVVNERE